MGFFYRTIRMVENDLKPCYVFDGKPPQLKSNVVSGKRVPSAAATGSDQRTGHAATTTELTAIM
jgi:flap endonuclease-1